MTSPIRRVFAHRNYALMTGGGSPSYITSWMQRVGVGWLAWELTHSPLWLGLVAAADLGPMLLLSPLAGAVIDRRIPIRQLRFTQAILTAQAIALSVCMALDVLTIELLIALSLWSGLAYPFHQAARHTVVPSTVPRSDLPTALGLDSAIFQVARFIGPSLAAIIIPFSGVGGTFAAHSLGCALFLLALFRVDLPPPQRRDSQGRSIFSDIVDGLAYVGGHIGIWPFFFLLSAASVLLRPLQDMLPGFAGGEFHAGAVGLAWLSSSMGIGAAASAFWIAFRGRLDGLTVLVFSGFFGLVLTSIGFVMAHTLWLGSVFMVLAGFSLNTMSTSIQALVQTSLHDHMRGRVMSLYGMIWRGSPALGAVIAGVSAEWIGLRLTFGLAATLCFLCWLTMLSRRKAIAVVAEKQKTMPTEEDPGLPGHG